MEPGRLRHTVTIQRRTVTRDSYGEPIQTWVTLVTRRASIQPMRLSETVDAGKPAEKTVHRITMRHTDITSKDRIVFGSRTFEVDSVKDFEERGRWIECICVEMT